MNTQLKESNNELTSNIGKLRGQQAREEEAMRGELELKNREIGDLHSDLEKMFREKEDMKKKLFQKQN